MAMTAERVLIWVLRVTAGMMLLALPAALLPAEWMRAIHRWLELGDMPDAPIVFYLARSLSAFYAFLGLLLLYLSFDVRRYGDFLRVLALASLPFGLGFLVLDVAVGMPVWWTLSEGPFAIVFAGLVLHLLRRVGRPADGTG
jgi:hypothetical protein